MKVTAKAKSVIIDAGGEFLLGRWACDCDLQGTEFRFAVAEGGVPVAEAELDGAEIGPVELLAIMAHTTGCALAMQDPAAMTPEEALEFVIDNVKAGFHEATATLQRQ